MNCRRTLNALALGLLLTQLTAGAHAQRALKAKPQDSGPWTELVKVEGQPLPIPAQWLDSPEAHIAHSLKLPSSVPQPQPFDFDKAWRKSWLPKTPSVAVQYFNHLCDTEAGQWVFKTVPNVEGLYFARPQGPPRAVSAKEDSPLTLPYALEMPWIQRIFRLDGDNKPRDQGWWFILPPNYNYRYVEQPKRNVAWQHAIQDPYIRLFGYTRTRALYPDGSPSAQLKEATPMQVIGTTALTARYGYTWRGLLRERDREHGISGGELLIYDLQTKEILASRRQFLIGGKSPRGTEKIMWEVAAQCQKMPRIGAGAEFTQFAFDVLKTIEPSKTGK